MCDGEEENGEERETERQENISIYCPATLDLRKKHDLTCDQGLLDFYRAVMERRGVIRG